MENSEIGQGSWCQQVGVIAPWDMFDNWHDCQGNFIHSHLLLLIFRLIHFIFAHIHPNASQAATAPALLLTAVRPFAPLVPSSLSSIYIPSCSNYRISNAVPCTVDQKTISMFLDFDLITL